MITTLLMIAGILFLALQLQDKFSIPSTLSLIALSFTVHYVFRQAPVLTGDTKHFASLAVLLLPVLLVSDSMEVKFADLKKHGISLLFLAVVAVILSVLMALLISDWLFASITFSSSAVILLFAMVLATDPVSVVSIFNKFELPHSLKFLAEGESLFNDATALIVFNFVGLYALEGGKITADYLVEITGAVALGSIAVGVVIGLIGLYLMKTTENRIAEMMIVIMTGYSAFWISEHFFVLINWHGGNPHMHLSGILSCIFTIIIVHHMMTQAIDQDNVRIQRVETELQIEEGYIDTSSSLIENALLLIKASIEERDRYLRTQEDIQLLALVANTILFVAMAEMIDLNLLWTYRMEILMLFLATTVIRGVMMGLFAWLTHKSDKMITVNFLWWAVLTFAGIKGGLSIVMLAMIPVSFPYLEIFKAMVIGVIVLSTFAYSGILLIIISIYREHFLLEKTTEK